MVEIPVTVRKKSLDQMTEYEKYKALENSKRCVVTTIQGVKVTLLKLDDQTTTFTFTFTGQPGEITQEQFMAAYGSQDPDFVYGLIGQLANASSQGGYPDADRFKFALSAVRGMKPRDPIEAQLLAQNAMMLPMMTKLANGFGRAEGPAEIESAERAFNRVSRASCAVTAAFDHHRNGDQKIAVQQVSIAGGAQAIVGDVHHNGAKPRRTLNGHANGAARRSVHSMAAQTARRRGAKSMGTHPRNTGPMLASRRCGAKTRSGRPCRSPAVSGKARCRMHGGAAGSGAPRGNQNALKQGITRVSALKNVGECEL